LLRTLVVPSGHEGDISGITPKEKRFARCLVYAAEHGQFFVLGFKSVANRTVTQQTIRDGLFPSIKLGLFVDDTTGQNDLGCPHFFVSNSRAKAAVSTGEHFDRAELNLHAEVRHLPPHSRQHILSRDAFCEGGRIMARWDQGGTARVCINDGNRALEAGEIYGSHQTGRTCADYQSVEIPGSHT
jgi:hypothetical protein